MDLDPDELNPMWCPRPALAASPHAAHRGAPPREGAQACRIALPSADVGPVLDAQRGAACVTQVITWDTPLMLLADDAGLAERIRATGLAVLVRGGTYAERQWDAREVLEAVAHRYYDHGEGQWGVRGMVARQPRYTVAVVEGAPQVRALLSALIRHGEPKGLVIDAREPLDLRVFVVDTLPPERVLVVHTGDIEEHVRAEGAEAVLHDLVHA